MQIAIEKKTGRIILAQQGAREGTCLRNAVAAGLKESEVEEREVSEAEYARMMAEQPLSAVSFLSSQAFSS